ncbi:histone deacetylase [Actinophytocola sp.]|uniref:histone deacetylase n=1 Tax=Actinophytocola sp. TaxID=1872138 RepID=UPI002ED447C1
MSLVWYVSYGSNMHAERFACYLAGGAPDGGNRTYPGCRDRGAPRATRGCSVGGTVYFATESPVWGGGRAFYDQHLPGTTFARAYLITEQQFADICNQEMYRPPGIDLDLSEVLKNGRATLGNGRYETLIHLDDRDSHPMLTFTAPWSYGDKPLVAPSGPYLRMLGHGLLSTHGWTLRQTADYLASLPGAADVWSPDEIIPMLGP